MLLRRVLQRVVAHTASGARSSLPKLVLVLLVLAALPALAYWRGLGAEQADVSSNGTEMVVENLELNPNKYNLVLKEKSGPRRLVISIGQPEAGSMIQDLNLPYRVDPPVTAYSMTRSITEGVGGKISRVVVSSVDDKAFFAKIVVSTDSREVAVDAAPSDAIALALRTKAPIFADAAVLEKAGIVSPR